VKERREIAAKAGADRQRRRKNPAGDAADRRKGRRQKLEPAEARR